MYPCLSFLISCLLLQAVLLPVSITLVIVPPLLTERSWQGHMYGKMASTPLVMICPLLQACLVEEQLFAGAHGEEEMYPTYMVILTSTLGIIVVNKVLLSTSPGSPQCCCFRNPDLSPPLVKVAEIGKMSIWGLWVCRACYAAKLAMLAVPEAYMVQPALLYALAVSAPVALYPINGAALSTTRHRVKIKPWQVSATGAVCVIPKPCFLSPCQPFLVDAARLMYSG